MPWLAAAIPAVIGAGTSIAGMVQQGQANSQASANMAKAIQEYLAIHVPDPEQQRLELARYQSTGRLSPQLETQIQQDPTAFEQIVKNQHYQDSQNRALDQLQSLGEEGGLSLSDKANLQSQLVTNANKDKANRDAITDEMARRGQGGSGMSLQAQLSGAQSAGDRDAMARLQTAGSARDRALDAISKGGQLAGTLGQQDYQRQSDLASARDAISRFNTTNAQGVQQRNVAAGNAAQTYNLDRNQDIANKNVALSNDEQKYNKGLAQQQFENQIQLASGKANAYTGNANQISKAGADTAKQYGAIGSGIAQAGGAIQNQNNWDAWLDSAKKKAPANMYGADLDSKYGGYA